jgi:Zn-dependent protease with chaperone function
VLPTSFALAALAFALAWPVPILLARAHWPARAPGIALLAWQSIALAGGLSMIGALLTYGLVPFGNDLINGVGELGKHLLGGSLPADAEFSQMFALSGAVLLGIHLLLSLATTFVKAERLRRRHQQLVSLLSNPLPERPDTLLIDHAAPVAYCLPGTTRSVTVLSAGLLALLDEEQLRAVIAHEEAHASQRHHLVLLAFRAWRGALPWFPIATRANEAVAMLVEMLADDQARRFVSDETLVRSILRVATESSGWTGPDLELVSLAGTPRRTGTDDGSAATSRIARLVGHRSPLPVAARASVIVAAIALIAVPTVLLVAPALG